MFQQQEETRGGAVQSVLAYRITLPSGHVELVDKAQALAMCRSLMDQMHNTAIEGVDIDAVTLAAAKAYGVDEPHLLATGDKHKELAMCRFAIWGHLFKQGFKDISLAAMFRRDRSTIRHGLRAHKDLVRHDRDYQRRFSAMMEALGHENQSNSF